MQTAFNCNNHNNKLINFIKIIIVMVYFFMTSDSIIIIKRAFGVYGKGQVWKWRFNKIRISSNKLIF
jgi:hypothetical protein